MTREYHTLKVRVVSGDFPAAMKQLDKRTTEMVKGRLDPRIEVQFVDDSLSKGGWVDIYRTISYPVPQETPVPS